MNYYEYTFKSETPEVVNEVLVAQLADLGFDTFQEVNEDLQAYIAEANYNQELEAAIRDIVEMLQIKIEYTKRFIKDENWNAKWESNFEAVHVKNCMIRASFHTVPANVDYDILINPKMSFGTGHHPTTSMMVEAMLDIDFKGKSVLDMGCGTGVLGILASKLGAQKIVGIDIDSWSFENANENTSINGVLNMEIHLGDANILKNINQSYHIILANINRNIILEDLAVYVKYLKPGGFILMSGFLDVDKEMVLEKGNALGLSFDKELTQNHWQMLQMIKHQI